MMSRRIGVSWGVNVYSFFIWLMIAALPIGAWIITFNEMTHRDAYGEYGGEPLSSLLVTQLELSLTILVMFYPFYRFATRSIRVGDEKIIARGFWRTRHLSWNAITAIVCSPFERAGPRAFIFGGTVVYVSNSKTRFKPLKVSSSLRRYKKDYAQLLSWAPESQKPKITLKPDRRSVKAR